MVMSLYRTIKGSTSGTYKRRRERSLGPLETLPREMVSRRKILSRSRDDLNLDQAYAHQQEEEEDVWYQKDKLYKEHIQEVLDKWTQIDDEIWAKVIVFERNRRVAKAYARAPVLTINGSDDGFDGMRIGLCGFDNPMRDQKTDEIKRLVSQGVKIKMDDAGNILIRRYSKSNVYIKSTACAPNEETAIGADILKLPNQALESEKIVKLFDMKKFQSNVNRELRRAYPDRRRLETQCLSAVAFVKSENEILDCPVWVLIVNVVAMDMLKSKLPPVQRPVDIKNRPRIPIPDEDPYSVAGNGGGSSGSSGFGTNGVGSPGHVAATREQLLLQTQQLAQRRSEKPPKLPPRDNLYPHDIPKPDYDDILEEDARVKAFRGKSDKGKDKQKYDDPYYCGLRARVPNFVKTSNGKLPKEIITKESNNNNNNSTIQSSAGSKHRMSVTHLQHPASLSSLHQLHQQPIHPAALMAAHQHHLQHQQAQQQMMWHARSYESGIGIYSHLKYMLETFPQPPPPSIKATSAATNSSGATAGGVSTDNHMPYNHNEIVDEHLLVDEDDTDMTGDMTDETAIMMQHDTSGSGGDTEMSASASTMTTNLKDRKGQQQQQQQQSQQKMTKMTNQISQTKQNKTTTSRTSQSVVSNKIKKSKLIATNSNNNLNNSNSNNNNNNKIEQDGRDDDEESFYRGIPIPHQRQSYQHPYYNNPQKNYPNYLYAGRYPPPFDPYDPQQPTSLDYIQPVASNYGVAPSVTTEPNHPNRWHSESDIFYYNKYNPVNSAVARKIPKPTAMDIGSWDSGDEYSADSIDRNLLPNSSQPPINPIKQLRGRARRDIIFPFDDENQQVPTNTQIFNKDGFDRKVPSRLSLRQTDEDARRIERTNDGRFSFRFLHPEAREFQRAGANRYSFSHLDRRTHYMPLQTKQNIVRKVSQPATIREEEKHFIFQKLPQKSMSSESVLISSTCFDADLPIDEHYRQQKLKIDEHLEMLVKKESGAAAAATSTLSSIASNPQQPKISKSRLTLMFARRIVAAASGRSSSKESKAAENARKKLIISSPLPLQTELVGEKATRILGADFIASAAATAANNKKLSHPLTTVQALQSITTQSNGPTVVSGSSNSNGTTSSSVSSTSQKTNSTQQNSHRHHHHHHHHKHQSRHVDNSLLIKSATNS